MRRIIACVNACKGVSTESLEEIDQYKGMERLGRWTLVLHRDAIAIRDWDSPKGD